MTTRCMIVDDEPLAVQALETLLARLDYIEIVGACEDALKAFHVLRETPVDLLFLDIEMPGLTGVDFLRSLKHPPTVIFVTAYREYALDAFELDVVDYLLKPVSFDRLLQALERYYSRTRSVQTPIPISAASEPAEVVDVKSDKKIIRVPVNEILYIEGMKDYLKIVTRRDPVVSKMTLKEMQEKLPREKFLRIHRSFIVNISRIRSYSSSSIDIDTHELPIGRIYKAAVMGALNAQMD